jgi:hypothetical protein
MIKGLWLRATTTEPVAPGALAFILFDQIHLSTIRDIYLPYVVLHYGLGKG